MMAISSFAMDYKFILILLYIVKGTGSECIVDSCDKERYCAPEGIYAANSDDCSSYFVCLFGEWEEQPCAETLFFDYERCVCDYAENCLECPTQMPEVTKNPVPCPPVPDPCYPGDRYADQSSCEHFYECKEDGSLTRLQCDIFVDQCLNAGRACIYDIYEEECMEPYEGFDCDLRCLGTTVTTVITAETTSSVYSTSDNVVSTIPPTSPEISTTPVLTTMISTQETSENIETTAISDTTVLSTVISSLFTSNEVSTTETWSTTPITTQYQSTHEQTTLQKDSTVTTDSTPEESTVVSSSNSESQSTTEAYTQSDIVSTNPTLNVDSTIASDSSSVPSTLVITSERQTTESGITSTDPITTGLLMISESTSKSDATKTNDFSISSEQTVTMSSAESVTSSYQIDTTGTSHIVSSSDPTHSLDFTSTSKQTDFTQTTDLINTSDQSDTTKTSDFYYSSDPTVTSQIISSISTSDTTQSTEFLSSSIHSGITHSESKTSHLPSTTEDSEPIPSGTSQHGSHTSIERTSFDATTSLPTTTQTSNKSPSTGSDITSTATRDMPSSKQSSQTIETSDIPTTTTSQSEESSERTEETTTTKEATTTPFTAGPEMWQIATLVVGSASAVGILMGLCFFALIAWHRHDKEPCVDGESSSLSSCDDRRKMIEPEKEDDAVFFKPALYRSTSQWSESAFTNPLPSQKPSFERSNSTVSSIWRYSEDGLDTIKMRDQNSHVRNPVYQPYPLGKT